MLNLIKKIIPTSIFRFFQPVYHYFLAFLGAIIYRFPSRNLIVIGVTGTKGKSTTTEIINSIFETAGFTTSVQNTLRFKIADKEKSNLYKMSMPGRFFMQKFLRDSVEAHVEVAILELTSEGARQYRNKFINLDALVFTNLAPEHIESHGSYDKYVQAKVSIAKALEGDHKKLLRKVWPSEAKETRGLLEEVFYDHAIKPAIIINNDDKEAEKFLALNIKNKLTYSLSDVFGVKADENGSSFQIGKVVIHSKLPGVFNVYNMLGASVCAEYFGISIETIKSGIESMGTVRGRMEKVELGQDFEVVVDYAHTPDSLRAVYETYNPSTSSGSISKKKLICILGNTGGGRDTWKRRDMGAIADEYCSHIILTNEDPYDEDPRAIVEDMKQGILNKPTEIIMDRRTAIATAIKIAKSGDAVLITGKGTDPYIMEANGKKIPWDDAQVVREELQKIL